MASSARKFDAASVAVNTVAADSSNTSVLSVTIASTVDDTTSDDTTSSVNDLTLEDVCRPIPDVPIDLQVIGQTMERNESLFGDPLITETLKGLAFNSKGHVEKKRSIAARFFIFFPVIQILYLLRKWFLTLRCLG